MEYNIKLINIYTTLRHSDLLDNDADIALRTSKESMLQFQNLLNKSLPATSTERLVFQTHRQLLKVSSPESIAIITKTKLWHLCLCSSITVLRAILNIPDSVVVTYDKATGYCVTTRLDKLAKDFPLLESSANDTIIKKTEPSSPKGDWVNVSKKQVIHDVVMPSPTPRQRIGRRPRANSERPLRVLKRGEILDQPIQHIKMPTLKAVKAATLNATPSIYVSPLVSACNTVTAPTKTHDLLEDAIKELKDMPSQNWADANDDHLDN